MFLAISPEPTPEGERLPGLSHSSESPEPSPIAREERWIVRHNQPITSGAEDTLFPERAPCGNNLFNQYLLTVCDKPFLLFLRELCWASSNRIFRVDQLSGNIQPPYPVQLSRPPSSNKSHSPPSPQPQLQLNPRRSTKSSYPTPGKPPIKDERSTAS